jgi:S1-C subfamily serine protease
LDSSGRIIGVNTAIQSPSGVYAGIGFAVPVDTVRRVVPQLVSNGRVRRPLLGIGLASPDVARRLGLRGVLLTEVAPGSPAFKAGMRPMRYDRAGRFDRGDLIVKLGGQKVTSPADLLDALYGHEIGETVPVQVLRGSKTLTLQVTLGRSK